MAKVIKINKKNNDFQHIEVIKNNRKKRSKCNEFFVEGAKSINNLHEHGWNIKSLIYSQDKNLTAWGRKIVKYSNASTHIELPLSLMKDLSDKNEDCSELLAIVEAPKDDFKRIPRTENPLYVVIDRPSNHGNLGTILRSCEGMGVHGVIITGHAVDLYDVHTIRASLGTMFSVPVIRVDSPKKVGVWLQTLKNQYSNLQVLGTTSKTDMIIDQAPLTNPTVILIGNETNGLSHSYIEMCDVMVKIPMYGSITSYNVACATSMILYEINRQRRNK